MAPRLGTALGRCRCAGKIANVRPGHVLTWSSPPHQVAKLASKMSMNFETMQSLLQRKIASKASDREVACHFLLTDTRWHDWCLRAQPACSTGAWLIELATSWIQRLPPHPVRYARQASYLRLQARPRDVALHVRPASSETKLDSWIARHPILARCGQRRTRMTRLEDFAQK